MAILEHFQNSIFCTFSVILLQKFQHFSLNFDVMTVFKHAEEV